MSHSKKMFLLVGGLIIITIFVFSYQKMKTKITEQEKANKDVEKVYLDMENNLYQEIKEKDFVIYAQNEIEKRCPFYKPDGVTYRECLYEWEQGLANTVIPELEAEVYNYCSSFTAKYTDETSLLGHELFTKCSIYNLSK